MSTSHESYFESLYGGSDDPYALRTRWYEARKRAVLLAALPHRSYRYAYEPGCGNGELTAALSGRCDDVLASDSNERAVELAAQRTRDLHNVRVEHHVLPEDWPTDTTRFDLIVLSELGYFLTEADMRKVASRCRYALADDGVLVACNWRPGFKERTLETQAVHDILSAIGWPRIVRHEEPDFLLEVWSREGRSVAQREGLRQDLSIE